MTSPPEHTPPRVDKRKAGSRLGRGLDALIGEYKDPARREVVDGALEIPVAALSVNPDQPRKSFPGKQLDELAASISAKGILQAILVRPDPLGRPGRYQIIAGERRWRAAKKAGLASIPAVVRPLDDTDALEVAIVENVQRTDLDPLEEAESFQLLIERFGRTQKSLSDQTGKSRSHIANTMRLLKLPPQVRTWIKEGHLSAGHARAALAAPDPEFAAKRMIERSLTVRQAEAMAANLSSPNPGPANLDLANLSSPNPGPANLGHDPQPHVSEASFGSGSGQAEWSMDQDARTETELIAADISRTLRMKVRIRMSGLGGELTISYRSAKELDELCRHLSQNLS